MNEIQVGDRVRITTAREGIVSKASGDCIVLLDNYAINMAFNDGLDRTVEVIEKAKPKWRDGDVAVFLGEVRFFARGEWYTPEGPYQGTMPAVDKYKLVMRDGKPVA